MKQDFRKYAAFQNAPESYEPSIMPEKVEKTVNADDAVLTAIYAIDPISNKPTGDISAYMSDKTSPDVKAYIMQNLMQDMSSFANPAAPASLSEDDVLFLQRRNGESRDAYIQRVAEFGKANQDIVDNARRNVPSSESEPSAE